MNRLPLSVALISYNEEENIGKTLESIKDIASEIIVVDSGSTDKTVEIAKGYGAKVFIEEWKGYKDQKNSALEKCSQDWILFLDCDEVVSEELKEEIIKAIGKPEADGYLINRKTVYLGKPLNYAWQPDWNLRLVRKSANPKWEGGNVHEYLTIDGKIGRLKGFLFHYTYRDIKEHFNKVVQYSYLAALDMYKDGKKFKIRNIILNPTASFIREYFLKKGFMDGIRGFIVAVSATFYSFLKYIYLWEIQERDEKS
ncbi:Glycosyltransferase involved in cell wall bisynthesis [Persephonella hydrogeniphila]|uniref:Glycosyltransferase involved in cell wall bisynthesis n=1 Tax=Persephonella hydrogeniphila TaxID=198703 RepID=A0A285N2J5_9AQUI|nr:glycosyltransferase family 2 protein [Persephonella hydrogeniphila]SNZ03694.1 Glycosyltransferase involved in cell wall bisynthesis [Persephonella hydrogeniphila]